jgi:hypothetical protein
MEGLDARDIRMEVEVHRNTSINTLSYFNISISFKSRLPQTRRSPKFIRKIHYYPKWTRPARIWRKRSMLWNWRLPQY